MTSRIPPLAPRAYVRIIAAAIFIAVVVTYFALGGPRYLSAEALDAHRDALLDFAAAHPVGAPAIALATYAATVALGLPGGFVFSLACGMLFGRFGGTLVAVCGETAGATLAFLVARHIFADAARARLGAIAARIDARVRRHAFSYLLFLRVVPLFPFFVVNIAPAFTTIPLATYVMATFVGAIPATFVYASLGETLGRAATLADALSPKTFVLLALLGVLALAPVIVTTLRERRR
ncbi:MAG: TVP38/TMEM64 family protein [Rudaea sp.]